MSEDRGISMNEFKLVVEGFQDSLKKVVEVMHFRFDQVDARFGGVDTRLDRVETRLDRLEVGQKILTQDVHSLKEQVALLHEGQTEIKHSLSQKPDREEFTRLEMRVAKLENKVA